MLQRRREAETPEVIEYPLVPFSSDGEVHWALTPSGRRVLLIGALLGCLLATVYAAVRRPDYTATAMVMVDNRQLHVYQDGIVIAEPTNQNGFVDTQVEVLKSDRIVQQVVDNLQLAGSGDHDDKAGPQPGSVASVVDRLTHWAAAASSWIPSLLPRHPASSPRDASIAEMTKKLHVDRVGLTSVVAVRFTGKDPSRAATVANAIVYAYQNLLDQQNVEASRATSAWLRGKAQNTGVTAAVITPAKLPDSVDSPGPLKIIFAGGVLGLLCGFAVNFARHRLDDTIRSPKDLEGLLEAEVLGLLPRLRREPKHNDRVELLRGSIPALGRSAASETARHPRSRYTHVMRQARAAVLDRMQVVEHPVVIGVTSVACHDGKTTVAVNLARLCARSALRVLLVDANPSRPRLPTVDEPGLIEVIKGEIGLAGVVRADKSTPLKILRAGNRQQFDASEILWADSLQTLIRGARADYEIILLDLPPLLPGAEVRSMGDVLDGLILVVDFGRTRRGNLVQALATAGPARRKMLGTLINRASAAAVVAVAGQYRA